uniref:Chromosome X open reading frame 57 n=2 Tax=Nothobranchius kuhntae TaxID=321403 RepID=A0A1A8I5M7_NOTKU
MEGSSSCSSVLSAPRQPSFLLSTLERLSSTPCLKLSAQEAPPVAVIALRRYLSEQAVDQQQPVFYSYDVTVTDGSWQAKCFLHPSLNHLVHTNTLRTGSDISVRQCSYVYNERRLGCGYICVEALVCGAEKSALLPGVDDIRSLPVLVKPGMERSMLLHSDVPLQPDCRHYLPLWNNDDPEGDIWMSDSPSSETVLDVSKVALLGGLESYLRYSKRPYPLLVKIIHKSRLRYYGRPGLKIHYPYQAYFEVADKSGIMSLVLWNDLCPEFYQRLSVGTVLYLQNYALKKSYSNKSRPQMSHYGMTNFTSTEISLNYREPAAVITIVSPKSVQPQWGLPEVSYQFTSRSELENLPGDYVCDVIGLVTFAGRVERVISKGNKGPDKYWSYRWVHAVDGTFDQPFILELFSTSHPDIFGHICPMTYLVCTQMRVCKVEGSQPYLSSSCGTEVFITGYHKGQPYVGDPRVKSFIQWTKTLKDNTVMQKSTVGGYYCYPHPPRFFKQTAAKSPVPLVSAADLKKELETLQYREHKRVAIQGWITAVHYTEAPRSSETQTMEGNEVSDDEQEQVGPEQQASPPTVKQTFAGGSLSPSSDRSSANILKIKNHRSETTPSCLNRGSTSSKRHRNTHGRAEEEVDQGQDCNAPFWEISGWSIQQQELSERLCQGGLHQDSIFRKFVFDERITLMQWSNLQPGQWTSEPIADPIPPASCPGYYQLTILGINKQMAVDAAFFPVGNVGDPRAVGLPQDPHNNTMLSCLSSGFLFPLSGAALPQPEEILVTASELEDMHLVCVLDLCHLGGNQVEVLLNKVYKFTEVFPD